MYLNRLMTKPTKWHVCTAKSQIRLGIRPVWSESSLSAWSKLGSLATYWAHIEDWSDWADAHFVDFVMRQLKRVLKNFAAPFIRQKKKKNASFLETLLTYYSKLFGTSENFSSIFKVFLMIFMLFLYQKMFPPHPTQNKKLGLPTDPKRYWDVYGNKIFIFLALL